MSTNDPAKTEKAPPNQSSDELNTVVEDLLNSLSSKFEGVSKEIFAKMDEMSKRLDNLEASLQTNQAKDTSPSSKQ